MRVLLYAKMLKETETEETKAFFVTFLSLLAFQLGGGRAPLWLRLWGVLNRLSDLYLNDMAHENVQMFRSRDWQTTAS